MTQDLDPWSHMWTDKRSEYALLCSNKSADNPLAHCIVYDLVERGMILMEDEELAQAIMERMLEAGVPIVTKDQVPFGQNECELMINRMIDEGKSIEEVNEAIAEYKRTHPERR